MSYYDERCRHKKRFDKKESCDYNKHDDKKGLLTEFNVDDHILLLSLTQLLNFNFIIAQTHICVDDESEHILLKGIY